MKEIEQHNEVIKAYNLVKEALELLDQAKNKIDHAYAGQDTGIFVSINGLLVDKFLIDRYIADREHEINDLNKEL